MSSIVWAAVILVALGVPSASGASFVWVSGGCTMAISGQIRFGDDATFDRVVADKFFRSGRPVGARCKGITAEFSSGGGRSYVALAIGKRLRWLGAKTVVRTGHICASACVNMWLGGIERIVEKNAALFMHSPHFNGRQVKNKRWIIERTKEDTIKYFIRWGADEEFIRLYRDSDNSGINETSRVSRGAIQRSRFGLADCMVHNANPNSICNQRDSRLTLSHARGEYLDHLARLSE